MSSWRASGQAHSWTRGCSGTAEPGRGRKVEGSFRGRGDPINSSLNKKKQRGGEGSRGYLREGPASKGLGRSLGPTSSFKVATALSRQHVGRASDTGHCTHAHWQSPLTCLFPSLDSLSNLGKAQKLGSHGHERDRGPSSAFKPCSRAGG